MSEPVATPRRLGRYEIQAEIGRGMMGVVYKAADPALGRSVALKVIRLAQPVPDDEQEFAEQRFLREASLAAGLSHPGIVVVHDVGFDPEARTPFMALEYLEGRTLAEIAARGPALHWRDALVLAARLADALHHAHAHGIVHRDIKPSNIMVLASGLPKILDFGIAKASAAQVTTPGDFWGTPCYMSPEQASGKTVDGRSDLFSLGAVLYELLTGRRAFAGDTIPEIVDRLLHKDPQLPSRIDPALPKDVDVVVMRALAKSAGRRYPDGRAVAEDIENVLADRPLRGRRAPAKPVPTEAGPSRGARAPDPSTLTTRPGQRGPFRERMVRFGPSVVLGTVLGVLLALPPRPPVTPPSRALASSAPSLEVPVLPPDLVETATTNVAPARVALAVQHGLKQGWLKVWVDERLVLERSIAGRRTRHLLFFKRRSGRFAEVLEVPPGKRVVRLEVHADGAKRSGRLSGVLRSHETRLLEVRVGGTLDLEWKS